MRAINGRNVFLCRSEGYIMLEHSRSEGYIMLEHSRSEGYIMLEHSRSEGYIMLEHIRSEGYIMLEHSSCEGKVAGLRATSIIIGYRRAWKGHVGRICSGRILKRI
jgi:hypothetical protein